MEHRFGRRQAVQLRITVHLDKLPPITASTRNVCRYGLNISLTHPELKPNRMVKVLLSDPNQDYYWQTTALVIHASEKEGTGLVLAESLPEDFYPASRKGVSSGRQAEFDSLQLG